MSYQVPRKIRLDLATPPEVAIRKAMEAVEMAGCDPLLTDAVVLLQDALGKVSIYVDRQLANVKLTVKETL